MLTKDHEFEEILAACSYNSRYCAKVLFPNIFEAEFCGLHDQIFDLLHSDHKKIAIAAPRGIGKTSIARLVAMQSILFNHYNFITYIQNSATLAEQQTENIKRQLLTNSFVRKIFGNIKESQLEYTFDEQFSKLAWVAFGRTLVLPRGSGQQVRGLNWSDYRPELFIIDDLEDKKECKNPEIRNEMKSWLLGDVMNSISRFSKKYRFIYIDTLKHEDSVLQMLMDSEDWHTVKLSICDENFKSNAPNFMTDAEILAEMEAHREKGKLDEFYMELMNMPIALEDAVFKQEYFRYYEEKEISGNQEIETIIICDPAKTVKVHSAETAIVAWGIDRASSKLYLRDVVHRKMYPDEIYDEIFAMAARFNTQVVGVEETSLNEFIKQPLKNEASRRGQFIEWVWLKPRGGQNRQQSKENRVRELASFYRQGFIYHNRACCGPMEQQLLSFPRSKLWDVMDCGAYVVPMLEIGERYFQPPEELDDEEAEFDSIEYEDELEGWRTI